MPLLENQPTFIYGLIGNILSFIVYMSSAPTFYKIFRKKTTEGFQSIPYSVALFSAMLMLYYAYLKIDSFMLVTINTFGCFIESIYLTIYMIYATKSSKIYTAKLLIIFNFGAFGLIILFTYLLSEGRQQLTVVGWICAVFSVCVYAAPLSIIRLVVRTKSVKYMPFSLSFCLTICAIMWFLYGLSSQDYFIATPNVLGVAFGVIQMILYLVYRTKTSGVKPVVDQREEANGIQIISTVETGKNSAWPEDIPVSAEADNGMTRSSEQNV